MEQLAPYATHDTIGRTFKENPPRYRSEFTRDRDRIIHSSAFRRLEYKTQVFINHEGDLFRTRLTHSLEVSQVAQSVASVLKLNTDLVDAICLAHDLGHTPFGHAGQDALNGCMKEVDPDGIGFEHNLQSLRVVEKLEQRYAEFEGLNLTFETKEGILKHCSPKMALMMGSLGERFILKHNPSMEAQLANVADEITYNYHDLDDGLRANLISIESLSGLSLVQEQLDLVLKKYPHLKSQDRILQKELARYLLKVAIYDLIDNTNHNLHKYGIANKDQVRTSPILVEHSKEMYQKQKELKQFLMKNLYKHPSVMQLRFKACNIIKSLFKAYLSDSSLLPFEYQNKDDPLFRVVGDYIAGMTDRYAFRQYNRLFTVENI